MFERYTENARRALFFARYEASQLGQWEITTEHLLLGLLREPASSAARMMSDAGVSSDDLRKEIEARIRYHEKIPAAVEIPFNAGTKCALQYAAEEADRLRHNHIGTEHLLLGILRREDSLAASVLNERGLRLQETREAIMKLPTDRPATTSGDFARASATLALAEPPSAWRDVSMEIRNINALLDRLDVLSSNDEEAQSLIRDIRDRIRALGSGAP